MTTDSQAFKDTLAQWSSGVTVVTTALRETLYGITVSSFASVSLEPPLISVCVAKKLFTHGVIEQSGVFAVNFLNHEQVEWAKRFAGFYPAIKDRFADITCLTAVTGCPVFTDAMGWLDCQVYRAYDGGDHTILVGEVVANGRGERSSPPLVYYNRQWGQFAALD